MLLVKITVFFCADLCNGLVGQAGIGPNSHTICRSRGLCSLWEATCSSTLPDDLA